MPVSRRGMGKHRRCHLRQIDRAAKCLEAAASSFAHNLLQESAEKLYFERMVVSNHPLSQRSRDEFASVAQTRGDSYVGELIAGSRNTLSR